MKVDFPINTPVELQLRQLQGELVESKFNDQMQYKFSSNLGPFWVSEAVGNIIHDQCAKLHVVANEPIEITKREVNRPGGRKGIQWEVSRVGFVPQEEEPVPAPVAIAPMPVASETRPAWAHTLANQTKQLIDVYADCVAHASSKHGNAIKPEDIRALMTTAFINLSKQSAGGNRNAA